MTTATAPPAAPQPLAPPARKRPKRKSRLSTAAVCAVVATVAWIGWTKTHPADDGMGKMLTAKVVRGDLAETVSATGSVTAQTGAKVNIGSQITGVIKKLNADVGTRVKKGDVIAELDLPDIKAQYDQAVANLAAAQTKLQQQKSGVAMTATQLSEAVKQNRAALSSAQAKLASAEAAMRQQVAQTPTDIDKARANLAAAQAALSTAKASLVQVQASVRLQINTANEGLTQAKANAVNSKLTLVRNQDLLKKGFVAQSVVDGAVAQDTVNQSLVASARENLQLVTDKTASDLQAARDTVTSAGQNVDASKAALTSALAEKYTDQAKIADVNDAREAVRQAQANLATAVANLQQNVLKSQDVEQAVQAVWSAKDQVKYAQAQWDKTFIRTPITGTVLQLAQQQGETLAAGLSAPTLIVVADLNRLQVDVYVDETDIGKVRLGQKASCTVDAFPHHAFPGKVVKIASGSTIQQGVVTYDTTIAIKDPDHRLRPDMTVSATLETGKRANVLLVPAEAVKIGSQGSTVNVLTKSDGKVRITPRPVKVGATDGINTEIRDGLTEGETIVRAGMPTNGPQAPNPFGPKSSGKGK